MSGRWNCVFLRYSAAEWDVEASGWAVWDDEEDIVDGKQDRDEQVDDELDPSRVRKMI
jgi:hypothetical protein